MNNKEGNIKYPKINIESLNARGSALEREKFINYYKIQKFQLSLLKNLENVSLIINILSYRIYIMKFYVCLYLQNT